MLFALTRLFYIFTSNVWFKKTGKIRSSVLLLRIVPVCFESDVTWRKWWELSFSEVVPLSENYWATVKTLSNPLANQRISDQTDRVKKILPFSLSLVCPLRVQIPKWDQTEPLHRGVFCQFPFRWIYYCHSSKSTGKETGKTHLCAF